MKTLKQLYRYFKPYRGKIILYIVLGLAVTAVAMISPYLQKYIFDNLLVSVPLELGPFTPGRREPYALYCRGFACPMHYKAGSQLYPFNNDGAGKHAERGQDERGAYG